MIKTKFLRSLIDNLIPLSSNRSPAVVDKPSKAPSLTSTKYKITGSLSALYQLASLFT